MISEGLEGWLLHKRPSGDTSLILSIFTQQKGRIDCLCKSGRLPKKQALLQPFVSLYLTLDNRNNWSYLRAIENPFPACTLKNQALFAAVYVNELLYYTLALGVAEPTIYDLYTNLLQQLVGVDDKLLIETLLRRFEWALLQSCGHLVSFSKDAEDNQPLEADRYYKFIPGAGFVKTAVAPFLEGQHILAFARGELDEPVVLRTAKLIMRASIAHLLDGRELKCRSFYKSLRA